MLLCGWFGFNAGSALSSVVSTQIAGCASATAWLLCSSMLNKRQEKEPNFSCDYEWNHRWSCGGFATFGGSMALKEKFGIDDALEVTTVHGVIGSLSIGLIASKRINPSLELDGLFYGGTAKLLGVQTLGVTVAAVWSGLATWLLLTLIEKGSLYLGLRVSAEDEEMGLDI
eukprot:gene22937-2556_t